MGKLNRFVASLLVALLLSSSAHAVIAEVDRQKAAFRNLLVNPGAEGGKSGITASSGTFAITTTSGQVFEGAAGYSWDASANGQTVTFTTEGSGGTQNAIPPGWYGKNGVAVCWIKAASGTAAHKLQVYDGTNVIAEKTIESSTTAFAKTTLNFLFPTSGNLQPRIAATQDEVAIYFDGCAFGLAENYNIWSVLQPYHVGSISYATGGSFSTHASSTKSDVTYSGAATVDSSGGLITAAASNKFGFTIARPDVGKYVMKWQFNDSSPSSTNCEWTVYDGTSTLFGLNVAINSTTITPVPVEYVWNSTGGSAKTFNLRGARLSGTGNCTGYESGNGPRVDVYFYPSSGSRVVGADQTDYGWTSYAPTVVGFGTTSAMNCRHRRVGENADIQCRFTSGTPTATEARIPLPAGCTSASTYSTVERVGSIGYSINGAFMHNVLIEPAVSYMTVGLQATTFAGLTKANGNDVSTSGAVLSLQASVRCQGWEANGRAPTLIGSVTSNSTSALRTETAKLTCSSSSAIISQSSTWVSTIGNVSSQQCAVTFSGTPWSSAPTCTMTPTGISTSAVTAAFSVAPTTSGFTIFTWNTTSGSSVASMNLDIQCTGPR